MRERLLISLALTCFFAASAEAAPSLDIGTIEVYPDVSHTFAIDVTGGGMVQGLDFYIQIGDGGTANGGTDTMPIITNVDIVGADTLFSASNTGQQNAYTSDLLWAVSTTTDTGTAGELDASGILAYVTIDTTGTSMGESYPLILSGAAEGIFGSPGVDTGFAGVNPTISNGTINIVPEPASMSLLALGGLALIRRRKA